MALPTVALSFQLATQAGAGLAGATVTAMLTRADRDLADGVTAWVFPSEITATADIDGAGVLHLWPNARGADGSKYRFTARTAAGDVLFDLVAAVAGAGTLADLQGQTDEVPPWPAVDTGREARLVQDIADLLAESAPSAETQRKVKRWIRLVLDYCEQARVWQHATNLVETTVGRGVDQFDLVGDVRAVVNLFGRFGVLGQRSLSALAHQRAVCVGRSIPTGGTPQHYALEALRRVHLFPVPREEEPLQLLYHRSLTVATLPVGMDALIVNGVLGRYGRHFDRAALSQDPAEFERRFMAELRTAGNGSWDAVTIPAGREVLAEPLAETVPRVAAGQVQLGVPG